MHVLVVLLLFILVVDASILHDHSYVRSHISRNSPSSLEIYIRDVPKQRCRHRNKKPAVISSSSSAPVVKATGNSNNSDKNKPVPASPSSAKGLIQVVGNCGPNGATPQITSVSGPNGNIDWMNCGFEGGGWNPPHVRIQDLITVPLGVALQSPTTPFKACAAYIDLFEKYGSMYKIPAIILASFAMQESSCQPWKVGGGGEQGLMQITRDKCGGAPGGNCQNPDFNIGQGAKFFSATLASVGGNVFLAVGKYNGWRPGLTKVAAFAAAQSDCCACQNNGDYLLQFFGGWILNTDPTNSNRRLGKYFNLDVCHRG